jgi:hypothetical protein
MTSGTICFYNHSFSFWNIDFVESLPQYYSLQACNQLESTFLALCQYQLYVSEELYDEYYDAIITHSKEPEETLKLEGGVADPSSQPIKPNKLSSIEEV